MIPYSNNTPSLHSMNKFFLILVSVTFSWTAPSTKAKDHFVGNVNAIGEVAKSVKAGDTITFASGDWKNVEIKLPNLHGTAEAPITVRALTPGETIITGASNFRFSGQYVVVKDFIFRDLTEVKDAVQFRSDSKTLAEHCRVTECVFDQPTLYKPKGLSTHWLAMYGAHNRVDHCYLGGKSNLGTTLVVRVNEGAGHHRIDHNHFGPRPELGENGGETIRVGTSDVSESDSFTIVEENYFESCDGEVKIISSKSCENIYRRNVFDRCAGSLTLRHGHRCLVEKNLFLGRGKPNTGGVRVIGKDHVVRNNYFEGLRGTSSRATLSLYCGIKNSPLNGYAPVQNARILHNTLIDCDSSLEIGAGEKPGRRIYPKDCLIGGNLFSTTNREIMRTGPSLSTIRFIDNANASRNPPHTKDKPIQCRQVAVNWMRDSNGMMRPDASEGMQTSATSFVADDIDGDTRSNLATIGCDEPGANGAAFPTKESVGPQW